MTYVIIKTKRPHLFSSFVLVISGYSLSRFIMIYWRSNVWPQSTLEWSLTTPIGTEVIPGTETRRTSASNWRQTRVTSVHTTGRADTKLHRSWLGDNKPHRKSRRHGILTRRRTDVVHMCIILCVRLCVLC